MSYSDEPNVISEQTRSKKIYFVVGGLILFFALLASVAFFPRLMEYRRANTPVGPHEGSLYFVSFEGARYSLEIVRSEPFDFHVHIFLQPVRDGVTWDPEEYRVKVTLDDGLSEVLEWHPETESFGPSEVRLHPHGDFRLELAIMKGEQTVWSARRWSFALGGGHIH